MMCGKKFTIPFSPDNNDDDNNKDACNTCDACNACDDDDDSNDDNIFGQKKSDQFYLNKDRRWTWIRTQSTEKSEIV